MSFGEMSSNLIGRRSRMLGGAAPPSLSKSGGRSSQRSVLQCLLLRFNCALFQKDFRVLVLRVFGKTRFHLEGNVWHVFDANSHWWPVRQKISTPVMFFAMRTYLLHVNLVFDKLLKLRGVL